MGKRRQGNETTWHINIYVAAEENLVHPKDKVGKENTVKPQWLEHLWDHGNSFETWVVRATEGQSWHQFRKQIAII